MKRLTATIIIMTLLMVDPAMAMNTDYSYLKFQDGYDEYTYRTEKKAQEKDNTTDEYHISPGSVSGNTSYSTKYGARMSYDEFRIPGKDMKPNDGYEQYTYSELHINPYYRNNVYYNPKGYRIEGFDESYYVNER